MWKVRCLVVKPNWSVKRVSSCPKLLRTNLWKSFMCILRRNKFTSWFDLKGWILWKDWIKTLTTMQLWSKKAVTVFYTKLLLWFKPFNGFFHLKAPVGVWCASGVISELMNCCPLAARTRRCVSAVTIMAVLCFVLWLDAHETFCSTSLCVHLPLRHPSTNQAQDFRTPVKFWNKKHSASFWGRSDTKPKWFVTLQHTVGCSCEEF